MIALQRAALAAAITLAVTTPLSAQEDTTLSLEAVNKANDVIDQTLEAYGGAETIAELDSVVRESDFTTWAVNQSRGTEPPWDRNESTNFAVIGLADTLFYARNAGAGGGFVFDNATLVNGDEGFQVNFRAGTVAPVTEPDFDTTSGPFIRVTAPLLVRQLQERRQTSHWLGTAEHEGRPHDVITLVMEVGPALSLWFDSESHLLTRMERVLPPFGTVDYRFFDYETVAGIPFARSFDLYVNGDQNLEIRDRETRVNVPTDPWVSVPGDLESVAAVTPDPMSVNELADGVHLVGGNNSYVLVVDLGDELLSVGGTQGAAAALDHYRENVADKPVRYGVLTHHHSDHVPGASAYANEGAALVFPASHQAIVEQAVGGGEDLDMTEVDDGYVIEGAGGRLVELHDIGPTPHSEHLLVAWLPEEGILFEADHFPQPVNGVIPPANPVTVALAEALERLEIEPRMIVGAHSPRVASPAALERALARGERIAQR